MAGYLTILEVAQRLRVSKMTVYRLVERGELPALRVGRSFRVRADDLEQYLEGVETLKTAVEMEQDGITLLSWK